MRITALRHKSLSLMMPFFFLVLRRSKDLLREAVKNICVLKMTQTRENNAKKSENELR